MLVYDQNDTLHETGNVWYDHNSTSPDEKKRKAAEQAIMHANTPSQTFFDTLGREVIAVQHNKWQTNENGSPFIHEEKYCTYTKLDIEGKPLWIRDARNNLVMQYVYPYLINNQDIPDDFPYSVNNQDIPEHYSPCYDIAGNLLFQHSMDAGDRWTLTDAAGKPMYSMDSRSQIIHIEYDGLHRPIKTWLHKSGNAQPVLVSMEVYGDQKGQPANTGVAQNLRGKLYKHYDQSGCITNVQCDFKGNVNHVNRCLTLENDKIADYKTEIDWNVDDPTNLLEAESFDQISSFDALNRLMHLDNWHKASMPASRYLPEYNQRSLLKAEKLYVRGIQKVVVNNIDPNYIIKDISYNAKGQKEKILFGNGTATSYAYDDTNFRLINIKTTRKFSTNQSSFTIETLQDLSYTYDAAGNITAQQDNAQKPIFTSGNAIDASNTYQYDALYRLIEATGREHEGQHAMPPDPGDAYRTNLSHPGDGIKMGTYIEKYTYDAVGNILLMKHYSSRVGQSWTRQYQYAETNNRLYATNNKEDNSIPFYAAAGTLQDKYNYNAHGSITKLPHLNHLEWDFTEHLQKIQKGTLQAGYRYDAQKQRTRKIVEHANGTKEERIYLGGLEIYRKWNGRNLVEENETLQLVDGSQRMVLIEHITQSLNYTAGTTLYRYQYSNHLGSASLELDEQCRIISYEEYHPYGTTAYQAVDKHINTNAKRYRYTGMERDEESGMAYHTARYYLPWLGRWLSCDPDRLKDGINIYCYVNNNPINFNDQDGKEAKPERTFLKSEFKGAMVESMHQTVNLATELKVSNGSKTKVAALVNENVPHKIDSGVIPSSQDADVGADNNTRPHKERIKKIDDLFKIEFDFPDTDVGWSDYEKARKAIIKGMKEFPEFQKLVTDLRREINTTTIVSLRRMDLVKEGGVNADVYPYVIGKKTTNLIRMIPSENITGTYLVSPSSDTMDLMRSGIKVTDGQLNRVDLPLNFEITLFHEFGHLNGFHRSERRVDSGEDIDHPVSDDAVMFMRIGYKLFPVKPKLTPKQQEVLKTGRHPPKRE
ncbi:MAG: RHS repeat-associated core domain-containing protein [Flavobacteriales bacterium]|nr:RHS repeat-associated core domain-containing protein [Flavobacteriales bacterium]